MTEDHSAQDKPIGYWLRHLDQLINEAFDRALGAQGLSRRQWQALNVVRWGPVDVEGLWDALRPFWQPGEDGPEVVMGELLSRGWVQRDEAGRYTMTADGEAGYAAAKRAVGAIRSRLTEGVTEAEYQTTMSVLRRMAQNLVDAAGDTGQAGADR